jgi:hypothetical protein
MNIYTERERSGKLKRQSLIAHQVFFKFKEGIDWQSEKAKAAEQATLGHADAIPEIAAWFCGRSAIPRLQAVDFSLIGYFASREDLDAYMVHPDHQKGVELWKEISTWTVSDIVVDAANLSKLVIDSGRTNGV